MSPRLSTNSNTSIGDYSNIYCATNVKSQSTVSHIIGSHHFRGRNCFLHLQFQQWILATSIGRSLRKGLSQSLNAQMSLDQWCSYRTYEVTCGNTEKYIIHTHKHTKWCSIPISEINMTMCHTNNSLMQCGRNPPKENIPLGRCYRKLLGCHFHIPCIAVYLITGTFMTLRTVKFFRGVVPQAQHQIMQSAVL